MLTALGSTTPRSFRQRIEWLIGAALLTMAKKRGKGERSDVTGGVEKSGCDAGGLGLYQFWGPSSYGSSRKSETVGETVGESVRQVTDTDDAGTALISDGVFSSVGTLNMPTSYQ